MFVEKSIAVLAFKNLSPDPDNEYFSDGMTEEIINALSQIEELKVTARTSSFAFKNAPQDIRQIGKKLGVSLVLEGSVRKSKDRLRINAKLIRTEDGFQVWSQNFDRKMTDIFALQDEISLLIADKIREHFGHLSIQDQLVKINTNNVTAYQYFLKGKYYYNKWNIQGFTDAAKEYERSLSEDPTFDLPYFGAGMSYSFLGSWGTMDKTKAFNLAEDYFARGNALKTASAFGHYSIAKHQFWGLWNYEEAHQTLSLAYQIQPNDSHTNEFMAEIHTLAGHFSTALKFIDTSLQIDPLSPSHYYTKANLFYLQGRIEEALGIIEKGLSIAPRFTIGLEVHTACLLLLGREKTFKKSLLAYEKPVQAVLNQLYHSHHEQQNLDLSLANQLIQKMQQLVHPPLLAWDLYLLLHSKNEQEAIHLLKDKVKEKMGQVINLKYDPLLKKLQGVKAFGELVQRHFPDHVLLSTRKKTQRSKEVLSKKEAELFAGLLLAKMEQEQLFLNSKLGLKDLADSLNLHPNKLSCLLNEKIGKNFYDFVNSYRLIDFKKRALDPQNQHLSLLGLAYDSGFNSKSVFNDYFKKTTGLTPRAWVRQALES